MIRLVFGLVMLLIVLLCAFSTSFSHVAACENVFKPETVLPNIVSALSGALALLLIGLMLNRSLRCEKDRWHKLIFLIVSVLFCCLQMLFAWNYYFETNWDVDHLVTAARDMEAGNDLSVHEPYFSENPNNLLLLRVFAWIVAAAHWLGMGQNDVFLLIVFQCLVVWLSGAMLFQILTGMFSKGVAWLGYFVFLSLVVVSPWVSIPYSDTVALLFPLVMAWIVCTKVCRGPLLKLALVCFVAVVGYKIKPQTLLVFFSITAVYGFRLWRLRSKVFTSVRVELHSALAAIAGLVVGVLVCLLCLKSVGIKTRNNSAFGMPHYLMMGMNTKTVGSYDGNDVAFSRSFETKKQRNKANLSEAARRIGAMGPVGFCKHLAEKTLINYYDGTFGWGWEGNFYKNILPPKNATLSPLARNLYYTTWPRGEYYKYWSNYAQIVWMGVLLLSLLGCFGKSRRSVHTVMLALVFVAIFEALFEARARYLYCFAPLYAITAAQGVKTIIAFLRQKKVLKKNEVS